MVEKDYARPHVDWVTLSVGEHQYEHDGIIVKPMAVSLNRRRRKLSVVERGISEDPHTPKDIDKLSGRISAWVVTNTLKSKLPGGTETVLYLSYPGNIQTEIEAHLRSTERAIYHYRRAQNHHHRLVSRNQWVEKVPGAVLAYTLMVNIGADSINWRPSHG